MAYNGVIEFMFFASNDSLVYYSIPADFDVVESVLVTASSHYISALKASVRELYIWFVGLVVPYTKRHGLSFLSAAARGTIWCGAAR
jgi:hypothetical protein